MKTLFTVLVILIISQAGAATFTVVNTNNTGAGSLRQAVIDANSTPVSDVIEFNIPGAAPFIISGDGYALTETVFINGTSQPGYISTPLIEIRGGTGDGFTISAAACELQGMAITGFTRGIFITSSFNKISGCYIGLETDGITARANATNGIEIQTGSGNIIGGTNRNVISRNGTHGIFLTTNSDNNKIFNCYVGLSADGTTARGNTSIGINLNNGCDDNRIGGASVDSMNVISANTQQGVVIRTSCTRNVILGNRIGSSADGAADLGNGSHGVSVSDNSLDNIIGGTGSLTRNLISGNGGQGIDISFSPRTIIKSNYIGVSASGLASMANDFIGVNIEASRECIIGGARATEGNIISNARFVHGMEIKENGVTKSNRCIVQGNLIGTDKDGFQNFGNNVIGLSVKSDSCVIGGNSAEFGNVICNTKILCGLSLANANYTTVRYNLIGLTLDSSSAPNIQDGITVAVENAGQTAQFNRIEYNAIAYNGRHGVNVGEDLGSFTNNIEASNRIRFNRIFCNIEKGIYLKLSSPADHGNNGKIAPAINTVLSSDTKLVGLIPSGLVAGDTIDVYRMTDCISCDNSQTQGPQGKYYVGSTIVQADGSWTYNSTLPFSDRLVATATDANGNTSQFSSCFNPCGTTASIGSETISVFLKNNSSQEINLTGTATFSALNPAAGYMYWMINTADTNSFIGKSTTQSIVLSGNGGGDLGSGLHTVYFVTNQAGCFDTARVQIKVLYIPNLITPNGDGKNDEWIITNTEGLYDVSIFNRWGDRVYREESYTNDWTAENLSDGTYYYEIKEKEEKGERYKGWVQVIH